MLSSMSVSALAERSRIVSVNSPTPLSIVQTPPIPSPRRADEEWLARAAALTGPEFKDALEGTHSFVSPGRPVIAPQMPIIGMLPPLFEPLSRSTLHTSPEPVITPEPEVAPEPKLISAPRPAPKPLPMPEPVTVLKSEPPSPPFGILGSFELKAEGMSGSKDWMDLLARLERERDNYAQCAHAGPNCTPVLTAWRQKLKSLANLPPMQQLIELNRYANKQAFYEHDPITFGKRDHWATPIEFLRGRGDCEDFAIFKFVSLLDMGIAPGRLRVAIVRDSLRRALHAVVTVELDGTTYVLDSLSSKVVGQSDMLRYQPLRSYSLSTSYMHIVSADIRSRWAKFTASRRSFGEDNIQTANAVTRAQPH